MELLFLNVHIISSVKTGLRNAWTLKFPKQDHKANDFHKKSPVGSSQSPSSLASGGLPMPVGAY